MKVEWILYCRHCIHISYFDTTRTSSSGVERQDICNIIWLKYIKKGKMCVKSFVVHIICFFSHASAKREIDEKWNFEQGTGRRYEAKCHLRRFKLCAAHVVTEPHLWTISTTAKLHQTLDCQRR